MRITKKPKELPFFELFEKFIRDSRSCKRMQPNGKRISTGTIQGYSNAMRLVKKFADERSFRLRLRPASSLSAREMRAEKNYWKKFYKQFTDYLYNTCDH